ncbi:MAG: hypothetical protein R3C49_11385 [Planctomycetaceae bacterium]
MWITKMRRFRNQRRGGVQIRPDLRVEVVEERILPAAFVVANVNDSGAGSLRQAILDANATTGFDQIQFAVPGTGLHTIFLQSELPALTQPVLLDGWSQPGYVDAPLVSLNGRDAGAADGLTVAADTVTIRGLCIQAFSENGILINAVRNTTLQGNYIGTEGNGAVAAGNGQHGVLLAGATQTLIGVNNPVNSGREHNLISGNLGNGVTLIGSGAIGNTISGNLIGTTSAGQTPLGNLGHGIEFSGAGLNVVGGTGSGLGNVISGNLQDGIRIGQGSHDQVIQGNHVGTGKDGTTPLGNGENGLTVLGGSLQGGGVVYTIDVSGSVASAFSGTPVGDVNGDGRSNSILDAELAGFIRFTETLVQTPAGAATPISIVVFANRGAALDLNLSADGDQLAVRAAADADGNGISDVIDILRTILGGHSGVGGGTSFSNGLQAAADTLATLGTAQGQGNVVFVSDGFGGQAGSQIAALEAAGVKRIAFGMGSGSSLTELQAIDPNAIQVNSTDEFSNALVQLLGGGSTQTSMNVMIGGTSADPAM